MAKSITKHRFRTHLEKRRRPNKKGSTINLVSMMDIFTILVFFLLVNSGEVETMSTKSSLKLPESISDVKPKTTLVIMVDKHDLVVQGRKIATLNDVEKSNSDVIVALKQELEYQSKRLFVPGNSDASGSVTIMGDKEIPYRVLKKIMVTCSQANFGNISLAVQQREQANI